MNIVTTIIFLISIIILLYLYFPAYFPDYFSEHERIKLLLSGNMKTSNCIHVDISDDKDKMKMDNIDKNKILNNLIGKYGINEINVSTTSVSITCTGPIIEENIRLIAGEINKIYGNNNNNYVNVIKDKNILVYSITNKDKFAYFKKSDNIEIPDVDFYVYGYGESPVCIN